MVKLWRRYKPFINAGIQELISYRVNFILYRIGDVMGAFLAYSDGGLVSVDLETSPVIYHYSRRLV